MTLPERLSNHFGQTPRIAASSFIAHNATLCGDVRLGQDSSIFYGAVLRADIAPIVIGTGSNIQDNAVVHLSDDQGVIVGDYVTVGHAAILHACTIEDGCLIGMGAIILDRAIIGAGSIVAAGALVTMGFTCPPGSMVMGSPAKVIRPLSETEHGTGRRLAEKYITVARTHAAKQNTGK